MNRKALISIILALVSICATLFLATSSSVASGAGAMLAAAPKLLQHANDSAGVNDSESDFDVLIPASDAQLAPALAINGAWINSAPLELEALRGRVVLLDFWTFRCPYCHTALPALNRLHARYNRRGLTIIGVHSPMAANDRILPNVKAQTKALGVRYPVVTDNDHAAWNAFGMQAWPTMVILDKQGRIRFTHIGEGMDKEVEQAVKTLLAE